MAGDKVVWLVLPPIGDERFMRLIGEVVHSKPEKGYSLVRVGPVESLEVYFMPHRLIHTGKRIAVGSRVEFEAAPGDKPNQRPLATKVVVLDEVCCARYGNDVCQLQKSHEGKHKDNEPWTDAEAAQFAAKASKSSEVS